MAPRKRHDLICAEARRSRAPQALKATGQRWPCILGLDGGAAILVETESRLCPRFDAEPVPDGFGDGDLSLADDGGGYGDLRNALLLCGIT